jgi:hypothetical protein
MVVWLEDMVRSEASRETVEIYLDKMRSGNDSIPDRTVDIGAGVGISKARTGVRMMEKRVQRGANLRTPDCPWMQLRTNVGSKNVVGDCFEILETNWRSCDLQSRVEVEFEL